MSNDGYEFIFLGGLNHTYVFVTDKQLVYEVKFKPSTYIFDSRSALTEFIFEFVIDVAENPLPGLPPTDAHIPITIARIFDDFFALKETVVVYICENADGRASARNRKFARWFETAGQGGLSFVKFDYHFGTGSELFYTSLIMRIDNPKMAEVIASFQKLSLSYNDPEK